MCTHLSILYDQTCVWCCTWQSVRQYRGARRAAAFMSPLLLRYIVTANMKSGLFCQKCVNKHGNASSEGHNSILRDKCNESSVAFGLSHKITEQTKVVTDRNDLILTFFYPPPPAFTANCKAGTRREGICMAIICDICESTSRGKWEGNVLLPFLKRQILLVLTFNISAQAWPVVLTVESIPSLNPVFTEPPQNNRRGREVEHSTITYSDQVLMKNSIYPEI